MPSKAAELRELSDDQLLERAESAREELFNLRFQLATGQLDDASTIKKTRHEIARIATVLRERDLESTAASRAMVSGTQGAEAEEDR